MMGGLRQDPKLLGEQRDIELPSPFPCAPPPPFLAPFTHLPFRKRIFQQNIEKADLEKAVRPQELECCEDDDSPDKML